MKRKPPTRQAQMKRLIAGIEKELKRIADARDRLRVLCREARSVADLAEESVRALEDVVETLSQEV
jgi:hypothetical protein